MNSDHTPLSAMLRQYAKPALARFCMPGHKGGAGLSGFPKWLARWDITELPGADNLHAPQGVIARAQEAAAHAFGAKHTFFLVNGATSGILAALLCMAGRRMLIGRDCHRSVLSGIALAGIDCEWICPSPGKDGLPGVTAAAAIEEALSLRRADGVLVTAPNYYGHSPDLTEIARVVHAYNAILIVDAAHGAHFPFSELLPAAPLDADIWVQSAHKTLCALGQGAYAHLGKTGQVSVIQMQRALSLVQTSSPSYPILASLDWARLMAQRGWSDHVLRIRTLRQRLANLRGIVLPDGPLADETRLCIDVSGRLCGYTAAKLLFQQGILVEFADARHMTLITSPVDPASWYLRLEKALTALPYENEAPSQRVVPVRPESVLTVRSAMLGAFTPVDFASAAGHVSAAPIGLYPPGIPLIMPGDRIQSDHLTYLRTQRALGAEIFGVTDGCVACVRNL